MPRTTVDIDGSILRELKARARSERKSLGRVISEIAATALKGDDDEGGVRELQWASQPMGARVDLGDKDALQRKLDDG